MYRAHRGWYKITNAHKFIKPLNEYMNSTIKRDDGTYIQYKSGLERIAFCYADLNPKVKYFSIEPFCIPYIKPTDNKPHRYFIDLFVEFVTGQKFIVEVKSFGETIPPVKPRAVTARSIIHYKQAVETYLVNQAKWESAKKFAESRGMMFIILTENELKK